MVLVVTVGRKLMDRFANIFFYLYTTQVDKLRYFGFINKNIVHGLCIINLSITKNAFLLIATGTWLLPLHHVQRLELCASLTDIQAHAEARPGFTPSR